MAAIRPGSTASSPRFEYLGADPRQHQLYRLELAPAFALLMHTRRTRVFSDQKVMDVVKSVLTAGGVTQIDLKASGAGGVMQHITQFEESDFAFVSRLLEQEGACYWFTHGKSDHTMVIGDAATHHPGQGDAIHASFTTAKEVAAASEGVVTKLSRRFEVVPKDAHVRDYSESHPKQPAFGQKSVPGERAPGAIGLYTEADYHVTQSDADATAYAGRLADRLSMHACVVVGASGLLPYRAGVRIAVHGHDGFSEHLLLSEVSHSFSDDVYANTFSAVPVSRLPWRPKRVTPIPRIDGVVPGIVTAAAGSQGKGEDGSYKVRLLNVDGSQERIMRMAQPSSGPTQGMHFPLQPNTEVLLYHEYGHPDRPVIAASMINAEDASPVKDANKTQSVLRTACGSQLVFEDAQGKNSITLSSPKGNTLAIDDEKEIVTLTAVKDHKVAVTGTSDTAVTGKVTIDSKDEIAISAANKITLTVGGSSITIEPAKITISTTEIVLSASGPMKLSGATIDAAAQGALTAKAASTEIAAQSSAKLSGATVEIAGTASAKVAAAQVEVAASAAAKFAGNATCDLEGAMINIKGTGVVAINGAMIKNN